MIEIITSTLIKKIEVGKSSRVENKEYIGEIVTEMMLSILKYGKL